MAMVQNRWLLPAVLVTLLPACAPFIPYRTLVGSGEICDLPNPHTQEVSPQCRSAAVENVGDKFEIAYVEFTDQGWLQKRAQLDRAFSLLEKPDPRALQVVVFIHGWKHSASADDFDVKHFRNVVVPAFTRNDPETRTVGIYVGWRGESISLEGLKELTFYDRKFSAEHVARGSVRELMSRLRVLRNSAKRGDGSRKVRVILVGHSFGGLILYNAIAESLLDSLVLANYGAPPQHVADPIVDLALVLNPAFEASRFEPLFQVAKQRLSKGQYPQGQRPIFISITAESDSATKTFFPLGRAINSILEHEGWTDEDCPHNRPELDRGECPNVDYAARLEKVANTNTIGHMPRYRTHFLTMPAHPTSSSNPIVCGVNEESKLIRNRSQFPLWTMFAKGSEVIQGHHGIYSKALWDFIASLATNPDPGGTVCKAVSE